MSYATATHISSVFKGELTFTATSDVTSDELDLFIEETDALIDSYLANRYDLPITNATDLLLIRKIAVALIAYQVANIKKNTTIKKAEGEAGIQFDVRYTQYKWALKMLENISSGKHVLANTVMRDSNLLPEYITLNNDEDTLFYDEERF